METQVTRDFLTENSELILRHINYEEYLYNNEIWACGWLSPCKRMNRDGGWFVYKK